MFFSAGGPPQGGGGLRGTRGRASPHNSLCLPMEYPRKANRIYMILTVFNEICSKIPKFSSEPSILRIFCLLVPTLPLPPGPCLTLADWGNFLIHLSNLVTAPYAVSLSFKAQKTFGCHFVSFASNLWHAYSNSFSEHIKLELFSLTINWIIYQTSPYQQSVIILKL